MHNHLAAATLALLLALGTLPGPVRADLRFAQPVVDLGRVRTGIPLAHQFAFVCRNAAEITDVKASCGCLAPRLPKRVFQRGEEGTLVMELNTLSQPPGSHLWRVQVVYRSEGVAYEMELQLKAELVTEVTVQPAALMVSGDRAIKREIVVRDVRPRPLLITAVRGSSPAVTAQVEQPTRDADGRWMCRINLLVSPEGIHGRREEMLSIYTDDPDYRELRVPITIIARSAQQFRATPGELTLTAPAGQPVPSQRLLIRDRDGRPVQIERVEAGDPALQVQWAQGAHRAATVKVSVDRARFRGELRTLLHVHVRQPVREVLAVPVMVKVP